MRTCVVVAVEGFHDGELGAAQQALAFACLAVFNLAGEHPGDGVDVAGHGPFEQVVDGVVGEAQGARVGPQSRGGLVRFHVLSFGSPRVVQSRPLNAMSYSLRSIGSS